jgi:hypothetical protein
MYCSSSHTISGYLAEKAVMGSVSIDSARAHDFLSQSRPRRNVEDKWHRSTPDFQSYYRFYNSIGHIEGVR